LKFFFSAINRAKGKKHRAGNHLVKMEREKKSPPMKRKSFLMRKIEIKSRKTTSMSNLFI
jgi:hypothetical protein